MRVVLNKILNFIRHHSRLIILILAVLTSVVIFIFRKNFEVLSNFGYFGLFILSVLANATIIIPVPTLLIPFVGGAFFNPFLVALVTSAGATIGELTGYFSGYGAKEIINKNIKLQRIRKFVDKYGLWTIFVLAAIPNPLFDLAGIAAGASEISVNKYLVVVFLGKLLKFAIISYLGAESVSGISKFF